MLTCHSRDNQSTQLTGSVPWKPSCHSRPQTPSRPICQQHKTCDVTLSALASFTLIFHDSMSRAVLCKPASNQLHTFHKRHYRRPHRSVTGLAYNYASLLRKPAANQTRTQQFQQLLNRTNASRGTKHCTHRGYECKATKLLNYNVDTSTRHFQHRSPTLWIQSDRPVVSVVDDGELSWRGLQYVDIGNDLNY